ncbi:MAG: FecR family protein [bacterium]
MRVTYAITRTALTIAAAALVLTAGAESAEIKATLVELKGTVMVKLAGADWTPAAEGQKVGAGASVRCMEDSSAFLKWADGNVVKLRQLTTFTVNALSADPGAGIEVSDLKLDRGKIFARAKKLVSPDSTFAITTPTAIAGVRGTDFAVEVAPDQTTAVAVVSGEVSVSAAGVEIILTDSLQTVIETGLPPTEPEPVPVEIMEELQGEAEEVSGVEAAVTEEPAEAEEAAEEEAAAAEEAAPAEEEAAPAEAAPTAAGEAVTAQDVTAQTSTDVLEQQININVIETPTFQECCQPR